MDSTDALIARTMGSTPQLTQPIPQQEQGENLSAYRRWEEEEVSEKENNPWNRIKRGLKASSSSIALGMGPSAADLKARGIKDPNFLLDLLEEAAEVVGDIPAMVGGGAAGAAVGGGVGGAAGAFAAPALVKSLYKEYLDQTEREEGLTFEQFLKSLGNVTADTAIAGAEGAVVGTVAKVLGGLAKTPRFKELFSFIPKSVGGAALAGGAATVLGEAAALEGIGFVKNGEVSPESFAKNLALILGFRVSHGINSKIKDAVKGKTPKQAETILEDLRSSKDETQLDQKLIGYDEQKLLEHKPQEKGEAIPLKSESFKNTEAGKKIEKEQRRIESLEERAKHATPQTRKAIHKFIQQSRERIAEHSKEAEVEIENKKKQEAAKKEEIVKKKQAAEAFEAKKKKEAEAVHEVKKKVAESEKQKRLQHEERKLLEHKPRKKGEAIPLGTEAARYTEAGLKIQKEQKRIASLEEKLKTTSTEKKGPIKKFIDQAKKRIVEFAKEEDAAFEARKKASPEHRETAKAIKKTEESIKSIDDQIAALKKRAKYIREHCL